ncbi:MAG TPA: retroviral-like aspartic protease family protein [Gemmatimonadaceae bacterium]|nr:retroviral-like aspartic protease family protein [Gemmatimonadaceae bacterium]
MRRLPSNTFHDLPRLLIRVGLLAPCVTLAACVHSPASSRPARQMSYWEALAELHPADAVSSARTQSEKEFAEALGNLMSGDIESAEERFSKLRRTANDSIIRAGARVVYTATLQYQEKWETLAALKREPPQRTEYHDRASIELWADAYSKLPPKKFTFRSSQARMLMAMSAVGTPLIPVRIAGKEYNFWLDTGSSLTMLASDVARDLNIKPLVSDTLEIVTSTGRVKAQPILIPQLQIGPLLVDNVPSMIVDESMMQMREPESMLLAKQVKIDGIIGFDIIRELDLELDYGESVIKLRNPATSRPDNDRNMFWVGLPVIRMTSADGLPLHFGLDTGAQVTFVTETLLDKLQISPARVESRRVGGLGGEISMRAPVMPDVRLLVRGYPIIFRGAAVRAPVYQVLASLDGVLGGDIWNSGVVRIDMTNGVFAVKRPRND